MVRETYINQCALFLTLYSPKHDKCCVLNYSRYGMHTFFLKNLGMFLFVKIILDSLKCVINSYSYSYYKKLNLY